MEKLNQPEWKHDLIKRVWVYARSKGYGDRLPPGLSSIVFRVRNSCDQCGINSNVNAGVFITHYQCCWVHTEIEDYCPKLCDECHRKNHDERPHEVVSV